MKITITITIILVCITSLVFIGCGGSTENKNIPNIDVSNSSVVQESSETNPNEKTDELLGVYHGVQPSYYLKNQYGEDMVVNGSKIPVPSIDFTFNLQENGNVDLEQINLEDRTPVYYHGTFSVVNNSGLTKIVCSLTDNHSSNPTYTLILDKSNNTIKCVGHNEPEFDVEKTNSNKANSTTTADLPNQGEEMNIDGMYRYKDESANISITINGDTWIGQTTIISGMGDEYDKPAYESGVIKGQELYESSGMVKIGYIRGRNLITTIGGNTVTLSK